MHFGKRPLRVIPGSQKGPVYDHHKDGLFIGGIEASALQDQLDEAVALTAPVESISIHHVRMLNASSENGSDRERPLLLFSYTAVDAFPIFEAPSLVEFDNRILRGDRTFSPRLTAVPARLPRRKDANWIFDNQKGLAVA
ncbi:MAG: hypothetical protein GDA40_05695 [Rhodobacteraceae bacterium]|nr:hypothetical protein [Paracoccaceae bacterium]